MPDSSSYPGTPRWVKISALISLALFVLVVAVLAGSGGPHSPGRHASSVDVGGHAGWGLAILVAILALSTVVLGWGWLADLGFVPSALPAMPRLRSRESRWTLSPGARKLVLTAHVTVSVGSLGSVAVFLALAVASLAHQDGQVVCAAYLAMDLTARLVIVPLLVASLLIGVIQALATPWGLFRHYWVLAKFLLTLFTVVVLLQQMQGIGHVAAVAADTMLSGSDLLELRTSIRTHALGGLLVLLVLVALSIYKPRGMTRYGWRKRRDEPKDSSG